MHSVSFFSVINIKGLNKSQNQLWRFDKDAQLFIIKHVSLAAGFSNQVCLIPVNIME